jgi:hypothetical protein
MTLHTEVAKARAADSAISTEEESCRKALIKTEKRWVDICIDYENTKPCRVI